MAGNQLLQAAKGLCESYENERIGLEEYLIYRFELIKRSVDGGYYDSLISILTPYETNWQKQDSKVHYPTQKDVLKKYLQFVSPTTDHPSYISENKYGQSIVPHLLKDYVLSQNRFLFVSGLNGQTADIYHYRAGVYRRINEDVIRAIIKETIEDYKPSLVNMAQVNSVCQDIMCDRNHISPDLLNNEEQFVNLQNGLLNLKEMTVEPHTSDVLSTVQLNASFVKKPNPPHFMQFLRELTGGNGAQIRFIVEAMGAVFSNVDCAKFKKAVFMVGQGNTGKSVLRSLINRIVGEQNYSTVELSSLDNDRFASSLLFNKRIAGSSDLNYSNIKTMSQFKSITGGDSIIGQYKGKQQFEFRFKGLLWFNMNELPRFSGDKGEWVYNRMGIVRCASPKPIEERDPHLLDKLWEERDDIVSLCLYALKTALERGYRFTDPNAENIELETYMIHNSPAMSFLAECTELRFAPPLATDQVTTTLMFEVFKHWCRDNEPGYKPRKSDFKQDAMRYFAKKEEELVTKAYQRYYYCFTLNERAKSEYQGTYLSKIIYHEQL